MNRPYHQLSALLETAVPAFAKQLLAFVCAFRCRFFAFWKSGFVFLGSGHVGISKAAFDTFRHCGFRFQKAAHSNVQNPAAKATVKAESRVFEKPVIKTWKRQHQLSALLEIVLPASEKQLLAFVCAFRCCFPAFWKSGFVFLGSGHFGISKAAFDTFRYCGFRFQKAAHSHVQMTAVKATVKAESRVFES